MATYKAEVEISAKDKTGSAFKSVDSKMSGLNKKADILSKTLGGTALVAGAAFTAFLVKSAKGAAQAEASMARVEATLATMGEAALRNKDAILQAAEATVQLGFDDEAAAESITKFYQRTNDLTKAQELNALAMDLARAKNIELSQASALVGQVLSGNSRALKDYGISLDETKTPLQALGELQTQVAGQAKAASLTFDGQMKVISESVSNLSDIVGGALLEAIAPFIKEFSEWASNPDVQMKVKEIAILLGDLAKEWIPLVVSAFKMLVDFGQGVVSVMIKVGDAILRAADAASRLVDSMKNSKVGKVVGSVAGKLSGARADGGPVMGSNSYLVGERGPEIFTPQTSGRIIPNHAMAGAGANITINITGNSLLDSSAGAKIADQIMRTLKTNLRI